MYLFYDRLSSHHVQWNIISFCYAYPFSIMEMEKKDAHVVLMYVFVILEDLSHLGELARDLVNMMWDPLLQASWIALDLKWDSTYFTSSRQRNTSRERHDIQFSRREPERVKAIALSLFNTLPMRGFPRALRRYL